MNVVRTLLLLAAISLLAGGVGQWAWNTVAVPGKAGSTKLAVTGDLPAPVRGTERAPAQAQEPAQRTETPGQDTPASGLAAARDPIGTAASRSADRALPPTAVSSRPFPSQSQSQTRSPSPGQPSSAVPTATSSARADPLRALEDQVVALTNTARRKEGCGPVRIDERLRKASREHSLDMKVRGYFDHVAPGGLGPWLRAELEGYLAPSAENIARGQSTAQAVVDAWMNSAAHRANILNCLSHAIGVGVATGRGGPWWTEMFGLI